MSVTMSKADGVTVLTLTADPRSHCPPLCQVLKGLCYSPVCCSVSQHLRTVQRSSQSVLGALHIMVGLLNIGLGANFIAIRVGSWWNIINRNGIPFWFGGLLILFGIMAILSEKCPSPCLVILNVIMNLAGVALAITAIVYYSINLANMWKWWSWQRFCDDDYYYSSRYTTPSPSPHDDIMKEKCLEGKELIMMLLRSINVVLIVLSVLELCVTISSVVMGIMALRSSMRRDNKSNDDPEHFKTLLEEVNSNPTS